MGRESRKDKEGWEAVPGQVEPQKGVSLFQPWSLHTMGLGSPVKRGWGDARRSSVPSPCHWMGLVLVTWACHSSLNDQRKRSHITLRITASLILGRNGDVGDQGWDGAGEKRG